MAYRENGLLERELQSRRKNEESFEQREKKIQENLTSLGHFRQYNMNRREKSRDDRITSLSEENEILSADVERMSTELRALQVKISSCEQERDTCKKSRKYFKNKREKLTCTDKIVNLTEEIVTLDKEKNGAPILLDHAQSELEDIRNGHAVKLKDGVFYSHDVRKCYMNLTEEIVTLDKGKNGALILLDHAQSELEDIRNGRAVKLKDGVFYSHFFFFFFSSGCSRHLGSPLWLLIVSFQ